MKIVVAFLSILGAYCSTLPLPQSQANQDEVKGRKQFIKGFFMAMRVDDYCLPDEFECIKKAAGIRDVYSDVDLDITYKRPRYAGLIKVIEELLVNTIDDLP